MPKTKAGYLIDDSYQGEYFTNDEPLPEFGGKGSGNYGHKGQAGGKVGGSGSGGTPKEMSYNGKIVYDFLKLVPASKTGWLTNAAIAKTMKAKYPNTLNQADGMKKFRESMLELWKNDEIRISPDGKKWKINEGDKYPFTGEDKDLNPDGATAIDAMLKKDEEKAIAAKEKDDAKKEKKKAEAIMKAKKEEEEADLKNKKAVPEDIRAIIEKMQNETCDAVFDRDVWNEVKDKFPDTTITEFRSQMSTMYDEGYLQKVTDEDGEERIKFFKNPEDKPKQEVPAIGKNRREVKVDDGTGVVIFDEAFADEPTPSEMRDTAYLDWYGEFKDEVMDEEKDAMYDYQDGDYDEINGVLRGKISEGDEYDYDTIESYEEKAKHIESSFEYASAELKEDTVVYRGTKVRKIEEIYNSFRSGKDVWYQDKGFMSTSIQEDVTNNFGTQSDSSVFLEIRLPKGSKVAPLQFDDDYKDEYEVLIPAGKKLKVIGVHKNDVDGYDRHYKFEYKLILQYMDE